MKYKLKILSPLHIGCGEEYNGLSYLMDKRKKPPQISILDEDMIFNNLNDFQIKKFVTWIENEKFPNLFYFFKNLLKDNNFSLQNQLRQKAIYTIPNYAGNEKLKNINSFIKQINRPYIPGTEIKGAVRTAILYCLLLDNQDLFAWLKYKLEEFKRDYARDIATVANNKKPNLRIKNNLAKSMASIESEFQNKVLCSKPGDAKYDLMKFFQVGDSELLEAGKSLAISYVTPFNSSGFFKIFYEYLKPETEIRLSTLSLEKGKSIKDKIDHLDFNKGQKKIVSGMDTILKYCYRFSKDLLEEERTFFSTHGKQQIADQLIKIADLNAPETPVLRIGKDEGYNSLTIGLAVKKLDKNIYENILIHATKNKSYDSGHGGPMPKTRKIVHWNNEETTAGWVQLIPEKYSDGQVIKKTKPATPADLSMLAGKFNVRSKKK